jgi:hypothetical protein
MAVYPVFRQGSEQTIRPLAFIQPVYTLILPEELFAVRLLYVRRMVTGI